MLYLANALCGFIKNIELNSFLFRYYQEKIDSSRRRDSAPAHAHGTFELICITGGQGSVFFGDARERVKEGQCLLIRPNVPYRIVCDESGELYLYGLHFSDDQKLADLLLYEGASEANLRQSAECGYNKIAATADVVALIQKIFSELSAVDRNRELTIKIMLCSLFLSLNRSLSKNPSLPPDANALEYIEGAKKYIADNLNQPLSPAMIAKALFISSGYLMHLFKDHLCMTLMEYVYFKRVEKSRELLCDTDEKITAIAPMVGIPNTQYFSVLFKKQTGMTPREYRQKYAAKTNVDE